jgi:hypothetical protein
VASETMHAVKCPTCDSETIVSSRPVYTRCHVCQTKHPTAKLIGTADPLPPPPTRDGDKGGPAMGEGDDDDDESIQWPPPKVVGRLKCIPPEEYERLIAERDAWKARAEAAEKALQWIGHFDDAYLRLMCAGTTLHIDMAGKAREVLRAAEAAKEGKDD